MRPVEQERREDEGDCLRAGVASLLGVPLDQVPDLLAGWHEDDETGWLHLVNQRLDAIGYCLSYTPSDRAPRGWSLQLGQGPGRHAHVVVCWSGQPVHDPMPGSEPRLLEPHFAWLTVRRCAE